MIILYDIEILRVFVAIRLNNSVKCKILLTNTIHSISFVNSMKQKSLKYYSDA